MSLGKLAGTGAQPTNPALNTHAVNSQRGMAPSPQQAQIGTHAANFGQPGQVTPNTPQNASLNPAYSLGQTMMPPGATSSMPDGGTNVSPQDANTLIGGVGGGQSYAGTQVPQGGGMPLAQSAAARTAQGNQIMNQAGGPVAPQGFGAGTLYSATGFGQTTGAFNTAQPTTQQRYNQTVTSGGIRR